MSAAVALAARASADGDSFPHLSGDQRLIDEQVWVPFTEAILTHNLEKYFSVHSADIIRAEGGRRRVSNLAAYRKTMETDWAKPPAPDTTFELRFTHRLATGASAFETGYYLFRSRDPQGELRSFYGAFAVTLRQEEGRWKILVDADGFGPRPTAELFNAAHPLTTVRRHGPYLGQRPPGPRAELFAPGLVSASGRREASAVFAPDGRTFYFTLVAPDGSFATHEMHLTEEGWSDPVRSPFAQAGNTGDAFVAPSGQQLYFGSTRPPGTPPWNGRIWVADRTGDGWGEPRLLGLGIDTEKGVGFPTLSNDGILYVSTYAEKTSLPNLGKSDIYFTDTKLTPLVVQHAGPPISSPHEEWDPFIAPDGSYLLFQSDRPGGVGDIDIWVSFRQPDGSWGEPLNPGPEVNSRGTDVQARVTPDGRFILFERPTRTEQDIWWVSTEAIHRLRPVPKP